MFKMISSPHSHSGKRTSHIMLWVILAMIPAFLAKIYYFGYGVVCQAVLAVGFAVMLEWIVTFLRKKPSGFYLSDFSVILTALILALAIPSYAPYWIILIGTFSAVIVGKHVYGGLGQNLFNPAMIGYVVLLISFPVQMTSWLIPVQLLNEPPTFADAVSLIFTTMTTDGFTLNQLVGSVDALTQATPLDAVKTQLKSATLSFSDLHRSPIFMTDFLSHPHWIGLGLGWFQINLFFLLGGIFLLWKKIIHWQIPTAYLIAVLVCSIFYCFFTPKAPHPLWQLFSGATMFGAFFIATDPVTAAITPKGRLIFGALVGILLCLIRFKGGYPDGVAFAVLLANICVPLIDHYTRPTVSGHQRGEK